MHPILKALGLEALPGPEFEILKKVLNDNLVTLRAQELMVRHFAAQAIQEMHPVERTALLKKINPPVDNKVRWVVSRALHSGRPNICARWRTEEIFFDGVPENAPHIEFHAEHPSSEILLSYSALYDPSNAARMDVGYWISRNSKKDRA